MSARKPAFKDVDDLGVIILIVKIVAIHISHQPVSKVIESETASCNEILRVTGHDQRRLVPDNHEDSDVRQMILDRVDNLLELIERRGANPQIWVDAGQR